MSKKIIFLCFLAFMTPALAQNSTSLEEYKSYLE